ncbi:hypothetical protein TWF281_001594 [Arthrobotrys megalospora]
MRGPWSHNSARGSSGSNPSRGVRGSSRPNSALAPQNPSYSYPQSHGHSQSHCPPRASAPYTAAARQSASMQRYVEQDPGVEPVNGQPQIMGFEGYSLRGASQTDITQASDPQSNFDQSLMTAFDISPMQSSPSFQSHAQPNQSQFGWAGDYSGPITNQPDLMRPPNQPPPRIAGSHQDAEGEARPKKRCRPPSLSLDELDENHKYYNSFNYPKYEPPRSTKGNPMGTRSLDHHPDTELDKSYASYRFQNDPVKYWVLRDVAEKVPTKIREKELAYFKQLGIAPPDEMLAESKSKKIMDATGEVLKSTGEALKKSLKRRDKRPRMGSEGAITKGRRNWIENYGEKFPGEPVPSSIPNWRPTVHAVLHAGKTGQGPQDFNSLFINTIKKCDDAEFRSLLIQKLKSCRDSPHHTACELESSEHSEFMSFDGHSQPGPLSEGTSSNVHHVSRNPSVRSTGYVYNQNSHQREPSNTNPMSQDIPQFALTSQSNTLHTAFQPGYNHGASNSGTGQYLLSPTRLHHGSDFQSGPGSDGMSSFFSSSAGEAEPIYSQPPTTVPEMPVLPTTFTGVTDEVPLGYPYPSDLENLDSNEMKLQ